MSTKPDSSQIKFDNGTVQDVLDSAKPMADYTALRAYTGRATSVRITTPGIAGFFKYDATDTTSVDNDKTIIVSGSKRWKRIEDYYNPPGTGTFTTSLQNKLRETRSILDFIDPVHHTAIKEGTSTYDASARVNYAISEIGSGDIFIPPRSRLAIAAPIELLRGVRLIGGGPFDDSTGKGSKIFLLSGSNCTMLRTPAATLGATGATHYMAIENLLFDGNKTGQTVESEAVQFHGAWVGSWIRNVAIHNALGSALTLDRGADVQLDHVWILNTQSADGYAFDTNKNITGAERQGLLNADHLYVENTSNKIGGDPRNNEADRGKNIRLHRFVACHINELHTEGALRAVDIESNHLVRIGKLSGAFLGSAAVADSAMVRYVDTATRSLSIGAIGCYSGAATLKFVGLATGQASNNIQELPIENTGIPYVAGYSAVNADGFGTQNQAPTIFSRLVGQQLTGTASTSYYKYFNSNKTNYHYAKHNGGVLSFGSNWMQPGLSEKDFFRFTSYGNAADNITFLTPVTLASIASAGSIAANSIWGCSTTFGYGVGPVFQKTAGTVETSNFITTARRAAAPTVSADYVGQIHIDVTASPRQAYISVNAGGGSADWRQITT